MIIQLLLQIHDVSYPVMRSVCDVCSLSRNCLTWHLLFMSLSCSPQLVKLLQRHSVAGLR